MKNIAFYAPMKAPDHPVPSGDRLIAQLLMKAIRIAGFEVRLASHFRTRDGKGNPEWQQRTIKLSQKIVQRIIRQWKKQGYRPDAWFTYHLYYKAPDLIGPQLAEHYNIPYLAAEASWSGKRAGGNWQLFHEQLESALLQANRVLTINPVDRKALERFLPDYHRIISMRPFLDLHSIHKADHTKLPVDIDPKRQQLVTIAMMRPGDKLASYRLLAEAIKYISHDFQWFMVGDGKERPQIEALFQDDKRVQFCGQLNTPQVHALLAQCALHIWPAVNEAFGMTLLEAQYQGVAILSGDEGGVSSVMADKISGELVTRRDPKAMGDAIQRLLSIEQPLQDYRNQARQYVETHHDINQAAKLLRHEILESIKEGNHHA